ncbi:MAG: hypothetical protein H6955_08010 [Chromatiaceae bacterium]|nr:hypothetical protein [Gammaproteobacteria bacterium]MCP5313487.1 hypothetical protein [Chromatiaceae bacterium]
MKGNQRFSLLGRIGSAKSTATAGESGPDAARPQGVAEGRLQGDALEQAYRDLLVEFQLLAETNQRLHERLARRERGHEESPAARELIQAQRNALAERSRRMRELEYENVQLKREQKRIVDESRRLSASLAKQGQEAALLVRRDELSQRELAAAKAALREKNNELLRLTDKYYQLEARSKQPAPMPTAANSDF